MAAGLKNFGLVYVYWTYMYRKEPKKENKHVLEIVQVTTHGIWIVPVGKKHPV